MSDADQTALNLHGGGRHAGTVFIVDDDAALRDALMLFLETEGFTVEGYASARAFLAACRMDWQGCLILDICMPEMDGLALQRALRARGVRLPTIFLTGQGDVPKAVQAIKEGALDFLEKPVSHDNLLDCVQAALARDAAQREEQRRRVSLSDRVQRLTAREREIMALVVAGLSSKQIGRRLNISFRTVEVHRRRIGEKTHAQSLVELAEMARVCGLT